MIIENQKCPEPTWEYLEKIKEQKEIQFQIDQKEREREKN